MKNLLQNWNNTVFNFTPHFCPKQQYYFNNTNYNKLYQFLYIYRENSLSYIYLHFLECFHKNKFLIWSISEV